MRHKARIDANQNRIRDVFRKMGATWQSLASVGSGCPDAVIGYEGGNYMVEIKDGEKPISKRRLTPQQQDWFANWAGQVTIIESEEQTMNFLKKIREAGL